jgi:hypothetical protein
MKMKCNDIIDTMVDRKGITSLTARTDLLVLKNLTQQGIEAYRGSGSYH